MKNEKFDQAVDEIVGFIVDVHKLQMDQLKQNVKTAYGATIHETDPHAIAMMIMDTPVISAQPAIHLRDEMMCTAEKNVTIGSIGDIRDLSFVKVGSDKRFGKEFYHHCPEANGKLIRLIQYDAPIIHQCPVCNQKYEQK